MRPVRWIAALAIGAAVAGAVGSCSDRGAVAPAPEPLPPRETTSRRVVIMRDNIFSPRDITIERGDTVLWFNAGSTIHTSTSGKDCQTSGLWNSGNMPSGTSFFVVFDSTGVDTTGTVEYYCIPHCIVRMEGTVTCVPPAAN